jgi:hypothetical protein
LRRDGQFFKPTDDKRDDRHTGYAGPGGAGVELVLPDPHLS